MFVDQGMPEVFYLACSYDMPAPHKGVIFQFMHGLHNVCIVVDECSFGGGGHIHTTDGYYDS